MTAETPDAAAFPPPSPPPETTDAAASADRVAQLTHGRLLRRNVLLNGVSWAIPALIALASIPILARELGPERFGLLALAWAAVGIFSLFDFGVGRALTRLVAERLSAHRDSEIRELVWSASWMLLVPTTLMAAAGVVLAPSIAQRVLDVPPALQDEATGVILLLALGIPALAHGVVLRGVLEAAQKFGTANVLRVPLAIMSYAGPLAAIPLGGDARVAVGIVVASRVLYWLAHVPALGAVLPGLGVPHRGSAATMRELWAVGGWITVSNVVSPLIVMSDRPIIAAALPIAATGWYGAAAEIAQRQWMLTAALTPVLFAALAAAMRPAPERAAQVMERSGRVVLLALLPSACVLAFFAEPGLRWWIGDATYSPDAAAALRWLAVGVYVNAFAQVAYAVLQSGVDARSPAISHLVQLPLYLAALAWVTPRFGVQGVAIVWLVRMVLDAAFLWMLVHNRFPQGTDATRRLLRIAAVAFALTAAAAALGTATW